MFSRLFKKKPAPKKGGAKKSASPRPTKATPPPPEKPAPSFKPGKLITAEGWKRLMRRSPKKK